MGGDGPSAIAQRIPSESARPDTPIRPPAARRPASCENPQRGASKSSESPAADESGEAPKPLRFAELCDPARAGSAKDAVGFEPTAGFRQTDLQSAPLVHSGTRPGVRAQAIPQEQRYYHQTVGSTGGRSTRVVVSHLATQAAPGRLTLCR